MLAEGDGSARRLPFKFAAVGGVGRLALGELAVGPLTVENLELEVTDLGTDPGTLQPPERFQRRRTRLRALAIRLTSAALDERVAAVRKQLGGLGITQLSARPGDGFISVRARAADGLAAADLSFRIELVSAGTHLRAIASTVRVHGHLPTPGPLIADRVLVALLGATDTAGIVERPHARGLCDIEIDLVGALLWHLMPPSGWRLPAVTGIELTGIRSGRAGLEIAFGPAGSRQGELGVRPATQQLAAAHDLMHSVDQQLRDGHLEEAMRGYRALLASGGPDQPFVLERILALAAARPAWFFDGLELARQALGRWPHFAPAHAALGSITLAQGDAREAATHLTQLAHLASADGDDDQAALAALSAARLLRVLDARAATQLYQLALEHDPGSAEAADALADRLADEQRWSELVRLVRARAVTTDQTRAVQLRLRLADVFVRHLNDVASAQQELAVARQLAPDDPSVHEMTATILASSDPKAAVEAWRQVSRLALERGDHRTCARAWATLGALLEGDEREGAWRRALDLDPLQADALAGLAHTCAARGEHAAAADLFERLRGLGLPQAIAARHELQLARSLIALGRIDDARASLRRATIAGGETGAEAHAVLAEIAEATFDREHAAQELDTAIVSLVDLAGDGEHDERLYTRAAELAIMRALLLDRTGQPAAAAADFQRAHALAANRAPELARDAARTMLARTTDAGDDAATERRWIDAVLATRPPATERASLLVRRAEVRRKERSPDLAAALADLHEALQLTDEATPAGEPPEDGIVDTRRKAYQLEADLLAQSGDQRARAQALAALAKMAERAADRVEVETAAAAAWLAADEPAAALPHGARAHAELDDDQVPAPLRRQVLLTLGEAAWRQRAWPDVIRAYKGLVEDPGVEAPRLGTFRYRLAVAADRTGDQALAIATLEPLVDESNDDATRSTSADLRGQALRLYADLAERAGNLASSATALERFALLAVESSATSRADAMYRAGELFRRADRGDDAIRCLEAALRISDTHLPALDALEAAWRERGDHERVSVILGRKVAATARHPARQKPLLSRLGDLQAQLGRPDVALATHQRALEIDPQWRPSLRYVSLRLRDAGQVVAAAGGLAQLAGELPGDSGVDLAIVSRERQIAATALAELVDGLEDAQLAAVRDIALPVLERASLDVPTRSQRSTIPPTMDDTAASGPVVLAASGSTIANALARLRGEAPPRPRSREEDTHSGRLSTAAGTALSLRDAANRARAEGKLADALATLETANHVSPGDVALLRELVDLAMELGDFPAAARHLAALAEHAPGARRGDALLELADLYYDQLADPQRARDTMRSAAEAFGSGRRRDTTLRMLATEASTHLAWDVAVSALQAIALERRSVADVTMLANALARAGHLSVAIASVEQATSAGRLDDDGELLRTLRAEAGRKGAIAHALARAAADAPEPDATEMRAESKELFTQIGEIDEDSQVHVVPAALADTLQASSDSTANAAIVRSSRGGLAEDAEIGSAETTEHRAVEEPDSSSEPSEASEPVQDELAEPRTKTWPGTGTRDKVPAARETIPPPTDGTGATGFETTIPPGLETTLPPGFETTLPPALEDTQPPEPAAPPALARIKLVTVEAPRGLGAILETTRTRTQRGIVVPQPERDGDDDDTRPSVVISGSEAETATAVALAAMAADRDRLIAARAANPDDASLLLAVLAHLGDREPALRREILEDAAKHASGRALSIALHELGQIARQIGDTSVASDLFARAYEADPTYEAAAFAARATVLGTAVRRPVETAATGTHDVADAAIAEETAPSPTASEELERAHQLAENEDWTAAIAAAERASTLAADATDALALLENLYLEIGDITAASEAIGRQLLQVDDAEQRAVLWRRRARIYRDALGRDAEAYRCLKEAHACNPTDPEISYQLRTAAMVRGEWALAASLLYREIAASTTPRERGALHLELALIYEERLEDEAQAQVNFEQALAFDPTIPAARVPLARRYEAIGRHAEAAKLFEEAAVSSRASERASLLASAARARAAASAASNKPDLHAQLANAEVAGDLDTALELAHQIWRTAPGDAAAFKILANVHRAAGDLPALTELTSVRTARADAVEERASAWLDVARLAEEMGLLDQAARAYDLALIEDPGHVGALDARGALAFKLEDWPTADLIYRDLGQGESVLGDDELASRRSIVAEKLGRDTEALALAQRAAELAPGRRDIVMRIQELATRIGDLETALAAARTVLELVPLDDDEAQLQSAFGVVELMRQAGDLDGSIAQLDRVLRDHPLHAPTLELLAELHTARGDWATATRYLYQLVPLAPTPGERAERLYRLGEAVLVHLGDTDRADDVFLRASDLDPNHIPTLRRLLDVYWRADDPGALVEVATELADKGALDSGPTGDAALAHALVAAAMVGDTALADTVKGALGERAPSSIAHALGELEGRAGRFQLATASSAITELGRRGLLDIAQVRAAADGTPVANVLDS